VDLFPHQRRALVALESWLSLSAAAPTGVLCLPTGAGKTRTAAAFVLDHVVSKGPVLWLAHRTELIDQAVATLETLASYVKRPVTIGRWHRERTLGRVDVLVGSIPTLTFAYRTGGRNLGRLFRAHPRFALVVVDECHHGVAETWTWLIEELRRRVPDVRILGLSATPTRHAEQEQPLLWRLFETVVHEEPVLDLIDSGVLARPAVIPVDTEVTFDATASERLVLEHGGDVPSTLLERIAASEARNSAVVDTYLERRDSWGQTLIFAATVKQARWIAGRLRARRVEVVEAYAQTAARERAEAVAAFREKRARVLVNVGLFTEGTDLPGVEALFLARPTRSRVLFQQMVGRGMRGPRTGGGEAVAVVAFHESIVGLLKDRLASSFSSERDALLALGFPGERLPARGRADVTPEDPAMNRLVELSWELLAQSEGARTGASRPLRGFWEARVGKEKFYLPVFGFELAITSSWVNELRYRARFGGGAPALPLGLAVPATVLTPFAQAASRLGTRVRWIDLDRAERDDVVSVATALEPAARALAVPATLAVPQQVGAPDAPDAAGLLARLRAQPRSEWRSALRAELADRHATSPRDEAEILLDLLEAALTREKRR
jgi:superfamily II DNA or RNA helicase